MTSERLRSMVRGLGLRARLALVVSSLLIGFGVVGTHIGVEQQSVALEERWITNARGVLDLMRSGTTNLVVSGDVEGLHDVLRDVRRYRGVADAHVLDARGRVLSGTASREGRLRAVTLARSIRDEDTEPHLVMSHGYLDTVMPLAADGKRVGALFVRYDVREVRAEAALAREGGLLLGLVVTTIAVIVVTLVAGRLTRALVRLTEAARVAAEEDLPRVLAAVRDGRPVGQELLPDRFEVSDGAEVQRLAGALNTYRSLTADMAGHLALMLRERDARFRSAFDGSPVGMALVDPGDGHPVAVNAALCRLLSCSADELTSTPLTARLHPEDRPAYDAQLVALLAGDTPATPLELRYRAGDGTDSVWTIASLAVHRDESGAIQTLFVQLVDATSLKRAEADLIRLAYFDPLTDLPNRRNLLETLDQALDRARMAGSRMAALALDLDHFKVVNDSLGHDAGDKLLREVAARLAGAVPEGETVARFGGDEFVVVIATNCDEERALQVADRIGAALALAIAIDGHDVHVSASIGIAVSDGRTDAEELLRDADTAAYAAKAQGRNRHAIFHAELRRRADERLETANELHRALAREEIVPFYQPVVSSLTGDVVGFEALMRWQHPTRGTLAPGAFIDVALETGLIVPIGSAVLARACRDLAEWDHGSTERPWVSVNIDVGQLELAGFADQVRQILDESGVEPARVRLELTESGLVDSTLVTALRELRSAGVALAVDDFGTGYSSLHYLRRLPIDTLKMDRSFLEGIEFDSEAATVVSAIIDLSHDLDLTVVAEGVETAEQADALAAMGCDALQGYLFATPMPSTRVPDYLRARPSRAAAAGTRAGAT